jgi:two-component system chemotaxis response regulator CheB
MTQESLHVLVVDDTVTYRKIVSDVLESIPDVEVVGTAANGKIALQKIEQSPPDLLLLDVEMPEMDGLEVLRRLRAAKSEVGAIMLSSLTAKGAQITLAALELGAFDFALKPSGASFMDNAAILRRDLAPRLAAFARTHAVRRALHGQSTPKRVVPPAQTRPAVYPAATSSSKAFAHAEVVALGISTGGPKALTEMLPRIGGDFPVPILIVQHMPPVFTKSLADDLNARCKVRVYEAVDGKQVLPGVALIAPGGKQMRVYRDADRVHIKLTDDPPENSCRPSVDYLFRSVVTVYGGHTVGVIMTGMGNDGSAGCAQIKRSGGAIIAQDEASCVVFGMPREPIEQGIADVVAPLDNIASEITRLVGKGRLLCK